MKGLKILRYGSFYIAYSVTLLLSSCQASEEAREQRVLKLEKTKVASNYNTQLGLAYLNQGQRTRAKRKLLMALQLGPNSPEAHAAMGYYLEKANDYDNAEKYYKKALALAPNNGPQLNNYGTYLCRRGEYKQAEQYFLKAVQEENYVHVAGAYENAGLCATAIPDYSKAVVYFNKALAHDPGRKQSIAEIARIALKQQKGNKALKVLEKYSQQTIHDAALLNLGISAAQQEGREELVDTYRLLLAKLKKDTVYAGEKNEYEGAAIG